MKPFLLRKPEAACDVVPPGLATARAFPTQATGQPPDPNPEHPRDLRAPDQPPLCACFTSLVGMTVVRRRDAIHLRQGTLATRMGIHITKLSRFESGLGQAFTGPLAAACQVLGCTPAEVIAEARQYATLLADHGCAVVEHPGKAPPGRRSIDGRELPGFLLGLAVEAYRPQAAPASNAPGEGT